MRTDGWLFFSDALIRSVLHLNPDSLSDEEWALQVRMAESMQNMYLSKLGKLLGG